jgi:hypothetical protein
MAQLAPLNKRFHQDLTHRAYSLSLKRPPLGGSIASTHRDRQRESELDAGPCPMLSTDRVGP